MSEALHQELELLANIYSPDEFQVLSQDSKEVSVRFQSHQLVCRVFLDSCAYPKTTGPRLEIEATGTLTESSGNFLWTRDTAQSELTNLWKEQADYQQSMESVSDTSSSVLGGPCLFQWWESMKEQLMETADQDDSHQLEENIDTKSFIEQVEQLTIDDTDRNHEIDDSEDAASSPSGSVTKGNDDDFAQFKQRHVKNVGIPVKIFASQPVTDRKSTFQAFFLFPLIMDLESTGIRSHTEYLENVIWPKIQLWQQNHSVMGESGRKWVRDASHFIYAYSGRVSNTEQIYSDYDDGGEPPAGKQLTTLLNRYLQTGEGAAPSTSEPAKKSTKKGKKDKETTPQSTTTIPDTGTILVCRWYGGVHLGSARFRLIMQCAKEVMSQAETAGWQ